MSRVNLKYFSVFWGEGEEGACLLWLRGQSGGWKVGGKEESGKVASAGEGDSTGYNEKEEREHKYPIPYGYLRVVIKLA